MRHEETISRGSFTLRRPDVLAVMEVQRGASAAVVEDKTGLWRKLRLLSIIVLIPSIIAGIWLNRPPYMQIGVVILIVFGFLFKFSDWRIKRGMGQLGASRTVSQKAVVKAIDKRIFKGRDSVRGEARFSEDGFELVQDNVRFAANYDDAERIGLIFERDGILQITAGDARDLPDVIFFIPLAQMSDADAVMERVQNSSSFVFTHA
ncbi:hypothetical protein [Neorhizobium sp. NCHU2750]|uniref:hypothetical protein n=1 Tax=Neorhizobium sp. NCHU2750 TaxID=1825976 RepID=UPI000E7255F6|nr:hypothetical protein NCHU2750_03810 [Neorhizobium sp. NCHU2750]